MATEEHFSMKNYSIGGLQCILASIHIRNVLTAKIITHKSYVVIFVIL